MSESLNGGKDDIPVPVEDRVLSELSDLIQAGYHITADYFVLDEDFDQILRERHVPVKEGTAPTLDPIPERVAAIVRNIFSACQRGSERAAELRDVRKAVESGAGHRRAEMTRKIFECRNSSHEIASGIRALQRMLEP
jgi:hypothetical protein